NELEQVLDDYKEEELSEIEAYIAYSQEEYEKKTDFYFLITIQEWRKLCLSNSCI
ncbi:9184_t:CDS:1, partial [Funneliformis caledonium]